RGPGAAGPSLGRTRLVAHHGGDPATPALRRTGQDSVRRAATVAAALLVGACGSQAAPGTGGPSQLQAQVVASELVVGTQQRVPIRSLDHNTPTNHARVPVRALPL